MKKILFTIFLMAWVFATASAQDKGIKFETGTFNEILQKASEENKLVFIDIYAEWCQPCKRMAEQVFTQEIVGNYFNSNFINAKIDAEKGEGIRIAERYNVRAYPTFLLIDGEGALVGTLIGGSPAEDFIEKVEQLRKGDKQGR